jgi:hypothetical protein
VILHREKVNKVLGSAFRVTTPKLRHGSSSDKIQGRCVRRHLRRANRSLPPPLIDDSDSVSNGMLVSLRGGGGELGNLKS